MILRSGSLKSYNSFVGMIPVKVIDVFKESVRIKVTEGASPYRGGGIYTVAKRTIVERANKPVKVARKKAVVPAI